MGDRFNLGSKKMTHGTHLENSLDASNGKKGTFANSEGKFTEMVKENSHCAWRCGWTEEELP